MQGPSLGPFVWSADRMAVLAGLLNLMVVTATPWRNLARRSARRHAIPERTELMRLPLRRLALILALPLALGACAEKPGPEQPPVVPPVAPEVLSMYAATEDNGFRIDAIDPKYLTQRNIRQEVDYWTDEKPGTIIIDPWLRFLYYVLPDNRAMRYGVSVGDEGRAFAGEAHIPYARNWPSWRPTENMIKDQPETYAALRDGLPGGPGNPLGARAMYLHKGNKDTFYRIHGTMDPSSIGKATSAGCIRMFNQDAIHLEERVRSGARVVVLELEQAGMGTVPPGTLLPPPPSRIAPPPMPGDTGTDWLSRADDFPQGETT
ncbi:L,D-transpeptidase [Paracoccus sp. MBLB3053]|uniref:L,D-transpeptidase n=1 Tax=Paracoccus aurantius TaxID=3073814 RepID=A0ABU2HZ36_9RHOB|nr:L,D-transpeptidase [Paracoccus sp. MBLB3053]MDS9470012.1 L,D-transpeptidase [Paracoccus sp. MBLB3053]